MDAPRISLDLFKGRVLVRPQTYLGGQVGAFGRYQRACRSAGCRSVKDRAGQMVDIATIEQVPALLTALAAASFAPVVTERLATVVRERAGEVLAASHAAIERLTAAEERLAQLGTGLALYPFQREGVRWLAGMEGAILGDEQGLGKQQPVSTPVLTPTGWRRIGDVKPGDLVIGSDGNPTRVTGVFPQGRKPVFRVWCADGSNVAAGPDHLWTVNFRRGGKVWEALTLTTAQLFSRPCIDRPGGRSLSLASVDLYLPMLSAPVTFTAGEEPLPIDAYTLGALIANGSLADGTPALTVNASDAAEVLARVAETFSTPQPRPGCVRVFLHDMVARIRALALDVLSGTKHIPKPYMLAPAADRLALLHGLMDCDGSISATGNRVTYCTTSVQLARDVVELVECLGGIATAHPYDRTAEGKPIEYQVRMRLPQWAPPFSVRRKARRYQPTVRSLPCRIVGRVAYEGEADSVCIAVDARDRLYATAHAILTHNTVQALIAAPDQADGTPVLVVCPANVKGNWIREVIRWRPDLHPVMLKGRGSFRWPRRGELVSVNFDLLPKCVAQGREWALPPEIGQPVPGTVLVVDEIHKAKGRKTQRGRSVRALRKAIQAAANGGRWWGLSGTPLENYPNELWNVLDLLGLAEKAYGNWPNFVHIAGGVTGGFGVKWRKDKMNVPALQEGLRRVCLRRMVDDTVDLPPIVTREIRVDIDAASRKLVDEALARAKAAGLDYEAIAAAMAEANDEAKIITAGGIAFDELSRVRSLLAKAKIAALDDLVNDYEEIHEPLLVFSAHRAPIEHVAKRDGWEIIAGGIEASKRTQIVADYEAGRLNGVALTYGAGAEGITLVRGKRMIEVDWPWTSSKLAQARARFRRIGQKASTLFIDVLVANHPADELVHNLVAWKAAIIEKAVDSAKIGGTEAAPTVAVVDAAELLDMVEVVPDRQQALGLTRGRA